MILPDSHYYDAVSSTQITVLYHVYLLVPIPSTEEPHDACRSTDRHLLSIPRILEYTLLLRLVTATKRWYWAIFPSTSSRPCVAIPSCTLLTNPGTVVCTILCGRLDVCLWSVPWPTETLIIPRGRDNVGPLACPLTAVPGLAASALSHPRQRSRLTAAPVLLSASAWDRRGPPTLLMYGGNHSNGICMFQQQENLVFLSLRCTCSTYNLKWTEHIRVLLLCCCNMVYMSTLLLLARFITPTHQPWHVTYAVKCTLYSKLFNIVEHQPH